MNNESPIKAIIVVTLTALVCSILVTVTAVTLQPRQKAYQNLERNRAIVQISGMVDDMKSKADSEVVSLFQTIDAKIIALKSGKFDTNYNPDTFDTWHIENNPKLSVEIPAEQDLAKLNRRSSLVTVYLVTENDTLKRLILPIHGQGMWSKIYGFIALESDLNTIADITFYQQAETAGIGDQILNPTWQASWQGKKLFTADGNLNIGIGGGKAPQIKSETTHQIDAITGATVTVDAVKNMIRYWFGAHGYATFLNHLATEQNR